MAGAITISVIGDVRNLVGSLDTAEGKLGRLGNKATKVGKVVAGGLLAAGAAAVAFGVSSVKTASDAQQSLGATEAIFGRFAKGVIDTSNKAAEQFGLSANQYRESANLLGALFKNQGVSLDQLGSKTREFVGLGADLSAMYGGTAKDAVEALTSAFKGEFDPLERYGISLKASQISTEAAALAQSKYGKALKNLTTGQQKAIQQQATAKLLMQQTGDAQGQFAAQTNTLAEQQQILGAKVDNLKAKLGTALLPAVTAVVGALALAVPPVENIANKVGKFLAPALDKLGGFVRRNTGFFKPFAIALGVVAGAVGAVTLATAAFSVALNSTGIPLVIVGVAALVAGLVLLYQRSSTVRDIVAQVGQTFTTNVLPTLQRFGQFVTGSLVPAVEQIAGKIGTNLRPILTALAQTFQTQILPAVQRLAGKFEEWRPTIQRVIGVAIKLQGKWLEFQAKILGKVLPVVIRLAGFLAGRLIGSITRAIGAVVRIAGAVISFGTALVNGGKRVADFAGKVATQIGRVVKFFAGLPGKVIGAVGDLGGLLRDAGHKLIQGLIDGIGDMFGSVQNKLGDLTNKLTSWKGPPKRDKVLLRPAGRLIIQGLIAGIKDGEAPLKAYLGHITNLVVKTFNKNHKKDLTKAQVRDLNREIGKVAKTLKSITAAYARWKDLAKSTTDEARQFAALTNLTDFGIGATTGGAGIVAGLQARLDQIRKFNQDLKQLEAAHLSTGLLEQIRAAGVEGGSQLAEAFLSDTSSIKTANALQAQIAEATKNLGTAAATAVTGLDPAQVRKAAQQAAQQIRQIIRKRTGITIDVTTSSSSRQRQRVNADAVTARTAANTGAAGSSTLTVKLTAQQLSQLERGRQIALDLKAYQKAGGR